MVGGKHLCLFVSSVLANTAIGAHTINEYTLGGNLNTYNKCTTLEKCWMCVLKMMRESTSIARRRQLSVRRTIFHVVCNVIMPQINCDLISSSAVKFIYMKKKYIHAKPVDKVLYVNVCLGSCLLQGVKVIWRWAPETLSDIQSSKLGDIVCRE